MSQTKLNPTKKYAVFYPNLSMEEAIVEMSDIEIERFKKDPVKFYEEELFRLVNFETVDADFADVPTDNSLFYIEVEDEENERIIEYSPTKNEEI
jgi:hypothetical protein